MLFRSENTEDPEVKALVKESKSIRQCYTLQKPGTSKHIFKFKSRAIDPYIKIEGKLYRLTALSPQYKQQFEDLKKKATTGWTVKPSTTCQPVL